MGARAQKKPKKIRRGLKNNYLLVVGCLFVVVSLLVIVLQPPRAQSYPSGVNTAEALANSAIRIAGEDDMVLLPTPLRAIAKGEKLDKLTFAQVKWPKSKLSGSYIQTMREFESATALSALPANLPVPASAITRSAVDLNGLIERIPDGMRAITVKVDAESSVEGWARSGSYVDVIVLRNSKDKGIEAKVIAENIRILSAGRSLEPLTGETSAPQAPQTVTMLVTQEDALKIKTAANVGKLTFSLRGFGDQQPTAAVSLNQKDLLGNARTIIPPKLNYQGKAVGPDGKTYLLGEDSRWVRSAENLASESGAELAEGNQAGARAQLADPDTSENLQ